MMASRIGILIVAFLSYALVANGFFFSVPGLQGPVHPFINPPANGQSFGEPDSQRSHDFSTPTNDRVSNGSEQQRAQTGYRSNGKPVEGKEPGVKPAQPDPKPVQEPNPKPVQAAPARPAKTGLLYDFYKQSCPDAETIVNATIHKHFLKDPTYAAGFARLFFHDCFVTVRFSISNSVSSYIF